MNEINFRDAKPIDGYGPGYFRIDGERIDGAILVTASGVVRWGAYDDTDTLLAQATEVDVLLIGTGGTIAQIPADFRATLENAGIGVEIMASAGACRTYNILLSEGRRVGVALIPV